MTPTKTLRRRARTADPAAPTRHPWDDPDSDPRHRDEPEPQLLTANFDRRLAERLAPGCFRVLAAPPA